jgi:hypothetical protein
MGDFFESKAFRWLDPVGFGVGSALGIIKDKKSEAPAAAAEPEKTIAAPVMPVADAEAAKEKKRRSAMASALARGRQGTILSSPSANTDTLGG